MLKDNENQAIEDVSKAIYGSLSFSDQKIEASMNLPQTDQTDNEILTLALQYLLLQLFRIQFPASEMLKVSKGESVDFLENEPHEKLPARIVSISQDSEYRHITISGSLPDNGKNGLSELHFKWQKQAGAEDAMGNTDLKSLNRFPTVQKDDLLATIRERTFGDYGVTAQGKVIKPSPGKPLSLKYDSSTIDRRDDEKDPTKFYLYAKKSGIAQYKLLVPENPKTLCELAISNTITINGDIDYSVGDLSDEDLGCGAINIVVKGDVRGAFSIRSKGYISVSGTFEGQKIMAENIKVNVVTAGSEAIASNQVIVGTLIKAKAVGQTVTLKRASNDSELVGQEQVVLDKGTNCIALSIRTRQLTADSSSFSGRTKITLGQELFDLEQKLLQNIQTDSESLPKNLREIAELGEVATFNFRQLKISITNIFDLNTAECREQLEAIQEGLQETIKNSNHPLDPKLINICYSLQNLVSAQQAWDHILKLIEKFISSMQTLNTALHSRCEIFSRIEKNRTAIDDLRNEVKGLSATFENPKFTTNSSDVIVQCGNQQLSIDNDTLDCQEFDVRYELTGETGISKGELVIEPIVSF